MNTQDVFERAKKTVESIHSNIQTLEIQREEVCAVPSSCVHSSHSAPQDAKTVLHMEQVNLKKYRITSVEDALSVLEEAGDAMVSFYLSLSNKSVIVLQTVDTGGQSRGSASLDRGLAYQTRASQAITLSQRGKKDALHFTLGVRLFLSVYLFRFPYHWFLQVLQRRVSRSDKLALAHSQLDILEKALDEQKM